MAVSHFSIIEQLQGKTLVGKQEWPKIIYTYLKKRIFKAKQ